MRLVAGYKNDARTSTQKWERGLDQVYLGIAVQNHGVVLTLAGFHSTRCVQNQKVKVTELLLEGRGQSIDAGVVG